MIHAVEWIWITGNHDGSAAGSLGGTTAHDVVLGPLVFRHEAAPDGRGEVSGHYHPKATIASRGRRVTARCFATDGQRVILPAFGAYAGGLDVTHPIVAGLLNSRFVVHVLGRSRLHRFPSTKLARSMSASHAANARTVAARPSEG
jgi:metallophosphoesterase superfamily enzyme